MIYEIINMSDSYTIEAHDFKVAAVACVLLGNGQYAFEPLEKDGERVPIFILGGAEEWFKGQFNQDVQSTVDDVIENKASDLAECLDSCVIGSLAARRDYEAAIALMDEPAKRDAFRAERHDRRRSSMNDIGGRAYEMAKRLREKSEDAVIAAPQQVFGV